MRPVGQLPGDAGEDLGLLGDLGGPLVEQHRVDQRHAGALGQEVGQQGGAGMQEGHQRLGALEGDPLGEPFQRPGQAGHQGHLLARACPQGLVEDELAGRVEQHVVDRLDRALVADAEGAQRLDVVAPELDADRVVASGGEHVDDAAADGELAPLLDLRGARVAELGQRLDQPVESHVRAGVQVQRAAPRQCGVHRLQHGPDRGDHGQHRVVVRLGVGEAVQRLQPAPDGGGLGRQAFVREGLPRREEDDAVLAEERRHAVHQRLRVGGAGRDDQQGRRAFGEQRQVEGARSRRDGQHLTAELLEQLVTAVAQQRGERPDGQAGIGDGRHRPRHGVAGVRGGVGHGRASRGAHDDRPATGSRGRCRGDLWGASAGAGAPWDCRACPTRLEPATSAERPTPWPRPAGMLRRFHSCSERKLRSTGAGVRRAGGAGQRIFLPGLGM